MSEKNSNPELELKIMKVIKEALDNSDLEIHTFPEVVYHATKFTPSVVIMVNTDAGPRRAYTIDINK